MKVLSVLLIATIGSAAAFTTTSTNHHRQTQIKATAELDGLIGVDIESGKKIVRTVYT